MLTLEYIGSGDFRRKHLEYLKKEWLECGKVVENDNQFYKIQYEFLLSHNFYTAYMWWKRVESRN